MKLPQSPYRVYFRESHQQSQRELVAGRDFRLDEAALNDYFWASLPSRVVDLLRIAMSSYVIDRLVKRRRGFSGRWPRLLTASVEVQEPDFWNSAEIRGALAIAALGQAQRWPWVNRIAPVKKEMCHASA
jgi:hypothetical protein